MIDTEQPLPASIEAERTLLGAILRRPEAYYEAAALISEHDFYLSAHMRVFRQFAAMAEAEQIIDTETLSQALRDSGELEAIGGRPYVWALQDAALKSSKAAPYCQIILEKSRLRSLIAACERITLRAQDGSEKALDLVGAIQDDLESVTAHEADDPCVRAYSVAALDKFERERKSQQTSGISYGVGPELDSFTGGMRPGEVTVVGARSGVGKTSLACQAIAANCKAGLPCALFSLEMTREQILRRLWSIYSKVPYKCITDPWLSTPMQAEMVQEAGLAVAEWPLRIYDREDLSLGRILAFARICIRRHNTRFIAIDYAQEVDAPGRDERSKVMLVCRRLTRLVKHEPCSLMLLSQLVKTRREDYGKPPVVGDLIESGKLENVAHLVLLLHRGWDEEGRRIAEDAELIVPKQRRGDTGVLRAKFNRKTAIFEEV